MIAELKGSEVKEGGVCSGRSSIETPGMDMDDSDDCGEGQQKLFLQFQPNNEN